MIRLQLPLRREDIASLRAGDEVLLSGYRQYRIVETDKTLCVYAYAGDNAYDIFVFE